MIPDLLARTRTHFILWLPAAGGPIPMLIIGPLDAAGRDVREIPLAPVDGFPDLWAVAAHQCDLRDDQVYCYWFLVRDSDPYRQGEPLLRFCTDPLATTIDRQVLAPDRPDAVGGQPAGIVGYRAGGLIPCDPDGRAPAWTTEELPASLAPNHQLVIYELPTRWSHRRVLGDAAIGDGVFRTVTALLTAVPEPLDPAMSILGGQSYLAALGINALELLPPADSEGQLGWGYGTANYFAADYYHYFGGIPHGNAATRVSGTPARARPLTPPLW